MLMAYIASLVFMRQYIYVVLQLLMPVIKTLLSKSEKLRKKADLQHKLDDLRCEQKKISMMDEFAKYAKLQRKIDPLQDELKSVSANISQQLAFLKTIINWILHAILSLMVLHVIFYYRYTPVLQLPKHILQPSFVAKIVSFPTDIPGNVGCIFWLIVCDIAIGNLTNRHVN